MSTLYENAAGLGCEMPDDVLVLKARVAELEAKLALAEKEVADNRRDYYAWLEKRGRVFTIAEDILIELGLQRHPDRSTIVAKALEVIRQLVEDAKNADMLREMAGGEPRHQSYFISGDGDDQTTFDNLEKDLPDYDEEGGRVIEVWPVWHGRSRFVIVEYLDEEMNSKIHIFDDEDAANAESIAVKARQEIATKGEEG